VQAAVAEFQGEVVALRAAPAGKERASEGFRQINEGSAEAVSSRFGPPCRRRSAEEGRGHRGRRMVTVEVNGQAGDPLDQDRPRGHHKDDVQMLEDLVLAACNEALRSRASSSAGARQADRRVKIRAWARRAGALAYYPEPVARLIDGSSGSPGSGPRRRAPDLLPPEAPRRRSARALRVARRGEGPDRSTAGRASNVTDEDPCRLCRRPRARRSAPLRRRGGRTISRDGAHRRVPRPLPRASRRASPLDGIGPDDLKVRELLARIEAGAGRRGDPRDQPECRGRGDRALPREAPAPTRPRVTRIARGLPVGGDWSTPTGDALQGVGRPARVSAKSIVVR